MKNTSRKQQSETGQETTELLKNKVPQEPVAENETSEESCSSRMTEVSEPEEVKEVEEPPPVETPSELNEDEVLSYIGKRYGKEIKSIDDLVNARREESEELRFLKMLQLT